MIFSQHLIEWYLIHKRDLPWRQTTDPYAVWLSEIILQQTRVAQGLPYYNKFIRNFPTIFDLARASENDVLVNWQGLGYYSRARNLHETAKKIVTENNGVFPNTYHELLKLKGVGKYTAAAIASFCFNEVVPAIDGNVLRVIARHFGVFEPIDLNASLKEIAEISAIEIDQKRPDIYNQAMMEFGATICLPKNPFCNECPIVATCKAKQIGLENDIPYKSKKVLTRARYFNYFHIEIDNKIILIKRLEKDIWKNLYDLPLIETSKAINATELENLLIKNSLNFKLSENHNSLNFKHILSHQIIYATFWKATINDHKVLPEKFITWPLDLVQEKPISKLLENYFITQNIY